MRGISIGKHFVPLWSIAVILISGIGGALGYYVWRTLTLQVEVKEPIEILSYPSQLSLYPGENLGFNVSVDNHASVNYSVSLNFHLSNATYQTNYVAFSNEVYVVIRGVQNLTAWLWVNSDAPAIVTSLTIDFHRGIYPSGLIGYWKLDEGSGNIALDSSGEGNNGLIYGAAWGTGKINHALQLDGVDDYVGLSPLNVSGLTSITVAAWAKSPLNSIGYILYHGDNGEFCLHNGKTATSKTLGENSTLASFTVKLQNGLQYDVYSSAITSNAWHHLVGVWTKGDSLRIYVDGVMASEIQIPDHYLFDPGSYYRPSIGVYNWGTEQNFFEGLIDDVRIYDRALNNSEIRVLYSVSPE